MHSVDAVFEKSQVVKENNDGEDEYTSEFGDTYIDDNNMLVICVTKKKKANSMMKVMAEVVENIEEENRINVSDDVRTKLVKNSLNELNDLQERLSKEIEKKRSNYDTNSKEYALINSISSVTTRIIENKVFVSIVSLNSEKQQLFNKLFGYDEKIFFEDVDSPMTKVAIRNYYRPGTAFYIITGYSGAEKTKPTGKRVSMGYSAYKYYKHAGNIQDFVTCGHDVNESYDNLIYATYSATDGNIYNAIGCVAESVMNSNTDASFIRFYHIMVLQNI